MRIIPRPSGLVAPAATVSGGIESSSTLTHAQEFTISGSGFGTRADYNVDDYTWEGHRHIHYRFTDFSGGFPANNSSQATYEAALDGFYTAVNFNFAGDLTGLGISIENGGPSQSGKYFKHVSDAAAQGHYVMFETPTDDMGIPETLSYYTCWKRRSTTPGGGKKHRWRQTIGPRSGKNWYLGTTGILRESEWPYSLASFGNNDSATVWAREECVVHPDEFITTYRHNGVRPGFTLFLDGDPVDEPHPLPLSDSGDNARGSAFTWPNSNDSGQFVDETDIYFDWTAARVELWSDAGGTVREIQLCKSWSNTSIVIACNQGELSAGAVKIKVFDDEDTVVATFDGTLE